MPTSIETVSQGLDHYAVLSLSNAPPPSEKAVKNAYRRALLLHHPDKSKSKTSYSIDSITVAYKTLVDPKRRAEYDRTVTLNQENNPTLSASESHPGLETVDLTDMNYLPSGDEDGGIYWRGCRCSKEMAYEIPEKELEQYAETGEIVTPCQGCSLWLRVLFAVVEEEGYGQEG